MNVLGSFWAGALACGSGVDVGALGEAAGGFTGLEAGGYDALVGAGLDPPLALRWASTRPIRTRFRAVTLADAAYPPLLRLVPEPPPVLFVEGRVELFAAVTVGVVGTRSCTGYGASIGRRLGAALSAAGVVTVSGLARGVDAAAHRGAAAAGHTIAIVGHGLDTTSPAHHRALRQDLVDRGSVIVSTWPDDVPAFPRNFPVRNRWIAGWSQHLVVVEAPLRSGAGITAREATDLGRTVWAVPGPIGAPASEGCLRLLAEGARVVVDVDSFVATVTGTRPRTSETPWLDVLFNGATVDEAARRVGRPVSELLARLAHLELQGVVVRLPGQRYAATGAT